MQNSETVYNSPLSSINRYSTLHGKNKIEKLLRGQTNINARTLEINALFTSVQS